MLYLFVCVCVCHWPYRLVEVNGISVVNSTQEELTDILLQGPSAQIVVLRQPPPILTSQQRPLLPQHTARPDPIQTICPERDVVTMETPPCRRVMAIWWQEIKTETEGETLVMRMDIRVSTILMSVYRLTHDVKCQCHLSLVIYLHPSNCNDKNVLYGLLPNAFLLGMSNCDVFLCF